MQNLLYYKTSKCLQRECDGLRSALAPTCPFYHTLAEKRRCPLGVGWTPEDEEEDNVRTGMVSTGKNNY